MKRILPETILERIHDEAPPFKWASPETGFRSKIGGLPTDVPENEFPICPDCGEKMTFYGQLDSLNDTYVIADCGLIAVFLCFDCLQTRSEIVSG